MLALIDFLTDVRPATLARCAALAVLLVLAATAGAVSFQLISPVYSVLSFCVAVLLAGRLCGRRPAVLAILLSALAVDYYFIPPEHSLRLQRDQWAYFAAFSFSLGLTAWAGDALRRKEQKLRGLQATLQAEVRSRTQMESELRQAQKQFRQMADNISEIFWILDPDTLDLRYVSKAAERICETTLPEITTNPQHYVSFLHPEDRDWILKELRELVNKGKFTHEFRIVCPTGKVKWLEAHAAAVKAADGSLVALVGSTFDISCRKQAEAALRESEDRYRDLVESSSDLICTHDLQGNLLSMNRAPAAILGYEPNELIGRNIRDYLAPEVSHLFQPYLEAIRQQGRQEGLVVVLAKSGERRIWQYRNTLRVEGVATPIVRGLAHDITQQWLAQLALMKSEEKFRKAFRSSPCAMAMASFRDGRFIEVNEAFEKQFGHRQASVIGSTWADLDLWPAPESRESILRELANRGRVSAREVNLRRKSGELAAILLSAELIDLEEQNAILFVMDDVTERNQAQCAFLERTIELTALFENSPLAILICNAEGLAKGANPAFVRLFGYQEHEIKGKPLGLFVPAGEEHSSTKSVADIARARTVHLSGTSVRKDGTEMIVEFHGVPLLSDGKLIGAYGIFQDLTARATLEAEISRAQKLESIGSLTAGIAHDFNNLLTAIVGSAEQLRAKLPEGSMLRSYAETIISSGMKGSYLTEKLLTFARKSVTQPQVIDLNALIMELRPMLERLVDENIVLKLDLTPNLGNLYADASQLFQVVLNLAANARDAMPQGGELTIGTRIECAAVSRSGEREEGDSIVLSVEDTGCGITPAVRRRMFEPFFTTKEPGKGTGLGLSTVHGIVSMNRGLIRVESHLGRGTRFDILFPRIATGQADEASDPQPSPTGGEETIMVVESGPVVGNPTREFLREGG
jgi:PAS domain S-box-containing protein